MYTMFFIHTIIVSFLHPEVGAGCCSDKGLHPNESTLPLDGKITWTLNFNTKYSMGLDNPIIYVRR
jgi:hypothetical protein